MCKTNILYRRTYFLWNMTYVIEHVFSDTVWSKQTPPQGGISIYYVPWSRAVCKRFHDEMRLSHLVVKSLTHGSWSGNIVNRNPFRGGGVLSIKFYVIEHVFSDTSVRQTYNVTEHVFSDTLPMSQNMFSLTQFCVIEHVFSNTCVTCLTWLHGTCDLCYVGCVTCSMTCVMLDV